MRRTRCAPCSTTLCHSDVRAQTAIDCNTLNKTIRQPILLKTISVGIGFLIAAILVLTLNLMLDLRLDQKLYRVALLYGPSTPFHIHRIDPRLGQVHIPNTVGRHKTGQFDVIYTINADGNRHTPGTESGNPVVEILGDSFSFGHGVNDDETYAAKLQQHWPIFSIKNRSVMGAGASHALLTLKQDLQSDPQPPVKMVIYGWMWFHNGRSFPGKEQLQAALGNVAPYFEVIDGEPVYRRLLHIDDDLSFRPDNPEMVLEQEQVVIEALIKEMSQLCRERGIGFIVLMLPGKYDHRHDAAIAKLTPFLEKSAIEYINLHHDPAFPADSRDGLFIPYDQHPDSRWHQAVADALAKRIRF